METCLFSKKKKIKHSFKRCTITIPQRSFCIFRFKISDLVHTFGGFDDVQPMRKELEGEGVEGGIPLPHQGVFAFSEFKISDLVYTLGEFVKYCVSKI